MMTIGVVIAGIALLGLPACGKTGGQVYLETGSGVVAKPRPEIALIDVGKVYRSGTRVMARQASGFSPLHFVAGKVTKVHGQGAAYTIETDDGKVFEQSYQWVAAPF